MLYTVVGATIGIPVIVDTERDFCFQRHISLLRPSSRLESRYLYYSMESREVYRQAWEKATGTAQPTLPLRGLRSIELNVPPHVEQQEIVRRVDALFAVAAQIEARYEKARAHVDRLTQAVLAKAFRGELVPTEHALATAAGRGYESAEELLARIRTNDSLVSGSKAVAKHGTPKRRQKRAGRK